MKQELLSKLDGILMDTLQKIYNARCAANSSHGGLVTKYLTVAEIVDPRNGKKSIVTFFPKEITPWEIRGILDYLNENVSHYDTEYPKKFDPIQ